MISNYSIILKSTNKNILKIYLTFIKNIFIKLNKQVQVSYLPINIKRLTLLKSPHVYKKAREQFEIKTYKILIKIYNYKISKMFLNFFILNKPNNIKIILRKIV